MRKLKKRTVSYLMKSDFKTTPFIRLQGNWLKELGFNVGCQYTAQIEQNKIILILNTKQK